MERRLSNVNVHRRIRQWIHEPMLFGNDVYLGKYWGHQYWIS